jgi:hypothetical protein
MASRRVISMLSAALWVVFLALYVIAKIHFFITFNWNAVTNYLREHSIIWVAMATVFFVIWLVSKAKKNNKAE